MEKLARFLPLGLFCAFSVKLLLQKAYDPTEAAILFIMAGLSVYFFNKKSEELQELEAHFNILERKVVLLQSAAEKDAEEVSRLKREVEDTKSLIGGVKLGQQLRSQMNRN
jgi:hypothetical protein